MAERETSWSPTTTASIRSNLTAHAGKEPGSRSSSTASPPTSTPPTSLGDEASILSETSKMELVETHEEASTLPPPAASPTPSQSASSAPGSAGRRAVRNSRKSVVTYNVQILAGTAIHTPTKYLEKHHNNVVHGDINEVTKANPTPSPKRRASKYSSRRQSADFDDPAEQQLAAEAAQAAQRRPSSRVTDLRREAFRNLSGVGEAVANTLSGGKELVQNVLRRSASDSRLRSSVRTTASVPSKRPRTAREAVSDSEDEGEDEEDEEEEKEFLKPKSKQWLKQGLYVGQHRGFEARLSESQNRARKRSRQAKENKALPLPLFATEKMLESDPRTSFRLFKLPYEVFNPLPRKVKVDGWTRLNRNRFIGDASALWKREKHDDASQCSCDPEDGCGDTCHNRIMAYECDATNCPLTAEQCNNRPFAQLKKRSKGNGYDYGVEVMETEGKGYGVRAMRCFEPHQIIVEYAGEIITQTECERRMKQIYKKDKCYYLMSFDNKMIIDATRGTIARFVNHSCEPNCEMIKWTVGGEPRMALFAGSRGILTGEELTYDYNFDPFSLKNIQECRCGTQSCRGVLGPKPKKPANEERSLPSAIFQGAKRKLQDVFGAGRGSESAPNSPKKRNMGGSAMTKARNSLAQTQAAREQAEKEAAAHAAQIASRESRAMQRHKPTATLKRGRVYRKGLPPPTKPTVRSSRRTIFNIQRTVAKPGALKPVKHVAGLNRRPITKGIPPTKTVKSLARSSTPGSSSEDESPNITPASLRSARKRVPTSKAQVKPLKFGKEPLTFTRDSESDSEESEQSDDEDYGKVYVASRTGGKKRGSDPAPRGIHKTGAGVPKIRGRVRNARGRFVKK